MASKKEKDNQQLSKARLHFYNTLISSEAYKEFKSVCGLSTKYSQLATPIFAFLENYGSFKDLFGNQDFIPTAGYLHNGIDATLDVVRAFGSEHNVFERPTIKIKRVVTPAVSHQLLRFYATFIAPGAPLEVPFVTLPQREEISLELLHLVNSKLISGDIFDQVAKVVIETLFQRCFATYLKFKGVEYPAMKKSTVAHKEWAGSLELVEDKVSTPELSKKKSKSKFKWVATRDCMITVIRDPQLYAEFSEYVSKAHCEENLVLFESFSKLEERTRTFTTLSPALSRFLEAGGVDSEVDKPCPLILAPLFLFFNRMFIIPESPFEVNVTHNCRKEIEAELNATTPTKMFRVGIFDSVIDHVLALLYQNSFVNLVKAKEAGKK